MTTPWTGVLEIRDPQGELIEGPVIPMTQVSVDRFRIDASLRYLGETGLNAELEAAHTDEIRELAFDADRRTDLASVPTMLRWFENPYGAHTPAALIHDRHLAEPSPLTAVQTDLYFRSILKAVGVPVFRRWILWVGTALRTRWKSGLLMKALLVAYLVGAIVGSTTLIAAALDLVGLVTLPDWLGSPTRAVLFALAGWAVASVFWGRQWNAALIAGATAPWAIPVAAMALLGRGVYSVLERLAGVFVS